MNNRKINMMQKKTMISTIKKCICLVVVLTITLPLSDLSVFGRVNHGREVQSGLYGQLLGYDFHSEEDFDWEADFDWEEELDIIDDNLIVSPYDDDVTETSPYTAINNLSALEDDIVVDVSSYPFATPLMARMEGDVVGAEPPNIATNSFRALVADDIVGAESPNSATDNGRMLVDDEVATDVRMNESSVEVIPIIPLNSNDAVSGEGPFVSEGRNILTLLGIRSLPSFMTITPSSTSVTITPTSTSATITPTSSFFLNITPSSNWVNIPAIGGQRTVAVSTNAPTFSVFRPSWMTHAWTANGFRLTALRNDTPSVRTGVVRVMAGNTFREFTVTQLPGPRTLTISPSTNWTNLSAAGGQQRTVTVTTNSPPYRVYRPGWVNLQWTANGFRLTTQRNTSTQSRSGTVTVAAGGLSRSFTVSQVGAAPSLTISPTTNWTNLSAAGGAQRTVTVTTNIPPYRVYRPAWVNLDWAANGFRLITQRNTSTQPRSGTVTVRAGNLSRQFTVSQVGAAQTLTISPTTNWTNLSAAGGTQRTVTVTTNAPPYRVYRPGWVNLNWTANGFRLTTQRNTSTQSRSGTVTVRAGNLSRQFTVSQVGAAPTLTISPTTNWTNLSAAGGAQRTVTVTTNAPTYNVSRPAWLTIEWTANGFRLTSTRNTTAARSGTVTVTAAGLSRSFTVSQATGLVRLTFNGNGGTVNPAFRDVVPGSTVTNLPIPTRTNRHFVDWFTESASATGGNRFRNGMNAPNGNTTYWARWTDPRRHLGFWWRPANSGITTINYRVINNPNAIWDGRMRSGAILWNNSPARVNFTRNAASANTASLTTRGGSRIHLYATGTNLTLFRIYLDTNEVGDFVDRTGFPEAHVAHYIMAHEFGHAIGLDDNPALDDGEVSLMTQGVIRSPREAIVTSFDWFGVNMIY